MANWTEADIPRQHGRVAVVTGANSGIGFETARALAQRGARVVLACRDPGRARDAVQRMTEQVGAALDTDFVQLDLASLRSVRAAAREVEARYDRIDLLINNAGIINKSGQTEDGFEANFGVNHLGHYAFTGLLLRPLLRTPGSRVVTVSSFMHKYAKMDPYNMRSYEGYNESKLANLLFAMELHDRLTGMRTQSLAAHPGGAGTNILRHSSAAYQAVNRIGAHMMNRPPAMGALPSLRAATDPQARGGEYYGPDGFLDIMGHPVVVQPHPRVHDADVKRRLWEVSAVLTRINYQFDATPAIGRDPTYR